MVKKDGKESPKKKKKSESKDKVAKEENSEGKKTEDVKVVKKKKKKEVESEAVTEDGKKEKKKTKKDNAEEDVVKSAEGAKDVGEKKKKKKGKTTDDVAKTVEEDVTKVEKDEEAGEKKKKKKKKEEVEKDVKVDAVHTARSEGDGEKKKKEASEDVKVDAVHTARSEGDGEKKKKKKDVDVDPQVETILDDQEKKSIVNNPDFLDAALILVNDFARPLGNTDGSIVLHFIVEDFPLGDQGCIVVLLDELEYDMTTTLSLSLDNVSPGYHLIRAVLCSRDPEIAVKSPAAYVEAEFYVGDTASLSSLALVPALRNFMFGVPTIMLTFPTQSLDLDCPLVDYFVNNCELSEEAHGYQVRIYIDGQVLGSYRTWQPVEVPAAMLAGKSTIELKLLLIRPLTLEEIVFPPYNQIIQSISIE